MLCPVLSCLVAGLFTQEYAKHPFIVSLHHPTHYGFLCSGALVSRNVILTSSACMEGVESFAVSTSALIWTSTHAWNAPSSSDSKQHPLAAFLLKDPVTSAHLRIDICHDPLDDMMGQKPKLTFVSASGDYGGATMTSPASLESRPCSGEKGPCNATLAAAVPCGSGKGGVLVLEGGGDGDVIAVGVATSVECDFFGMISRVAYEPLQPSLGSLRRLVLTHPPSGEPRTSPVILSGSGSKGNEGGFNGLQGIARMGDTLYVSDTRASAIREVSLAAGGDSAATTLLQMAEERKRLRPRGIAVLGNRLYVTGNHVVARVDAVTGKASVFAGSLGPQVGYRDGALRDARFNFPRGIAISGGLIYVADTGNGAIRVVNMEARTLRGQPGLTVATLGAPEGAYSGFSKPQGLLAVEGNALLVTDEHAILKLRVDSLVAASVEVLAGAVTEPGDVNGPGASARFNSVGFMALNGTELFVSDKGNAAVRSLNLESGEVRTAYKGSPESSSIFADEGDQVWLKDPMGLAFSEDGSFLYVADVGMDRIVGLPRAALYTDTCGTGLEQHSWGASAENTTYWFGR